MEKDDEISFMSRHNKRKRMNVNCGCVIVAGTRLLLYAIILVRGGTGYGTE